MPEYKEFTVAPPALRPSEYTAALIHALQCDRDRVRGKNVLEMGSGSGVILAALADLGAASLCGIDVEDDAVAAGTFLLQELGHGKLGKIHQGSMWQPVTGRRFDLIAANLPHFAMEDHEVPGRHTTWSAGGPNGRRLLDPFLHGLSGHLAEGGRAVITHNGFVGLDASQAIAAEYGLSLQVVATVLVSIPPEKLALMTPQILLAEKGKSVHRYGPYTFADMHVVEIAGKGQVSNDA